MAGFFHPELYWLIIGVTLLVIEMAMPAFIIFFFGAGALITAAVAWVVGEENFSIIYQLLLFIVSSLLLLVALRGVLMRRFFAPGEIDSAARKAAGEEDTVSARPGDTAVVTGTIIPPAEGQLKYGGTFWQAKAAERIAEGETVIVEYQQGLIIHVRKIENMEEGV